jgi:MFS transporter, Spinster family, sphingosine-1-phosphate transporter
VTGPVLGSAGPDKPLAGARHALILLLLINLFNYIDRYILAAVVPDITKELFTAPDGTVDPAAKTKIGWLFSAFLIAYMFMSPVFGVLADRMHRWVVIGIGVLAWSVASGASGLATAYWFLLLMRICVGVGESAYAPIAPTIIADYFPVSRRGGVMAWFYAAIPVGSALGFVIGGAMANWFTWHWAFFVTVPPGILLGIWCFFRPEVPRGISEGSPGETPANKHTWRDYLRLFKIKSYFYNVGGMTAMTFAIGGISAWAVDYIATYRGQDKETTAKIFGGVVVVSGLLATLSGGYLADRLRKRFPGSYFLVSGLSMLVGFPLFLGVLYAPFPLAWVFVFLAVFCLFFNTGPSNTIIANVVHPSVRASAYAICIFVIHILGDVISPPIIGFITDNTKSTEHPSGNMTLAFLVVGVAILVGGVFWLLGVKHLERDTRLANARPDDPRSADAKPSDPAASGPDSGTN